MDIQLEKRKGYEKNIFPILSGGLLFYCLSDG